MCPVIWDYIFGYSKIIQYEQFRTDKVQLCCLKKYKITTRIFSANKVDILVGPSTAKHELLAKVGWEASFWLYQGLT